MKTSNKQPLSIYIHIPFCKRKCLYCDFLSAPACAQERESYVEALLREIVIMAEACREYEVITVFFGGGTPSLLDVSQMQRIITAIKENYDLLPGAEISMECNPATASLETLKVYRECGIKRLSIGLQSANDDELKALGRIHDYGQFLQTYKEAREAGFTNINVDLMSALPGQTVESYKETLEKVVALAPEHISAYSLIIEEGTPFYERYGEETAVAESGDVRKRHKFLPLPDEDAERDMYHLTNVFLEENGYARYEISNYAKSGYECRHNLTYWTGIDYIGFGIGAASYFQGYRFKNISDILKYQQFLSEKEIATDMEIEEECRMGAFKLPDSSMPVAKVWHEEIQLLSIKEKMEEFMFLGLRLKKGVSEQEFLLKFGKSVEEVYPGVVASMLKEQLLLRKAGRLYLSKRGTDLANYVMAQFLTD